MAELTGKQRYEQLKAARKARREQVQRRGRTDEDIELDDNIATALMERLVEAQERSAEEMHGLRVAVGELMFTLDNALAKWNR